MSVYLDTSFPHHLIHICLKLVNSLQVVVPGRPCTHTSRAMAQASFFRTSLGKIYFCATFKAQGDYNRLQIEKKSLHFKLPT